jgi:hypothetical protein
MLRGQWFWHALTIAVVSVLSLIATFVLFQTGVWALPSVPRLLIDAGVFFATLMIITVWGISILYRMQNKVAWTLFLWILLVTQFWLFSGFLKRFLGWDDFADRFFWHLSYGPMLFLPGLWLGLVFSDFTKINIKKVVLVLDIIAGILFILVMFNDLHEWAWSPRYDENGAITGWDHQPLYFIVSAYSYGLLVLSVIFLIYGTINKRNTAKEVLFMLIPLGLLLAYAVLYFLPGNFLHAIPFLNNYYVMYSLLGFSLVEVALESGLVQNAGFYRSFFAKGPFNLALAYPDYRLFERSEGFTMIEEIKTEKEIIKNGKRYRKEAIEGGYLLLEEDISDLPRLQKELQTKQTELQHAMKLLEGREKVEAEMSRLNIRSKLNESLFGEIRLESYDIEQLVSSLPDELTPESRKECAPVLESLQNRLAFLKQRCLFFINADEEKGLSYDDFSLSQGSLNRDLANVGFTLAVNYPHFAYLPLESALMINAFLHSLIEAFGDSRGSILVSFDPERKLLKARVVPTPQFDPKRLRFSPLIDREDEDYCLSLELKA